MNQLLSNLHKNQLVQNIRFTKPDRTERADCVYNSDNDYVEEAF